MFDVQFVHCSGQQPAAKTLTPDTIDISYSNFDVFGMISHIKRIYDPISFSDLIQQEAFYSGCQKNVALFKRFFLQPLIPQFLNSEHYYGKRYKYSS
jgi:hypothetical protein